MNKRMNSTQKNIKTETEKKISKENKIVKTL